MRLSADEAKKQHDGIKKLYEQGLRGATASVEQVLDLFDTIEALQQENEQLQAQVARVKKVLRKVRETLAECIAALELCTHSELCKIVISPYDMINDAKQTLAAIDKAIGGKEDYPCTDHDCYDKGNYHTGCESCPKYKKVTGGKEDA